MSVSHGLALRQVRSRVVQAITRIGADPADSDEVRFQKTFAVTAALLGAVPAQVGLGVLMISLKEPLVGWSNIAFGLLDLLLVIVGSFVPRHFRFLQFVAFLVNLFSPFVGTLLLGGLINASLAQLYAVLAPLLAIIVYTPRQAAGWFVAFVAMLILTVVLQPYLRPTNNLSPGVILSLSLINVIALSSLVFGLLLYAFRQVRREQARADALLLNILPKDIAAILKTEERVIADHYDSASILFADVVNFTPLSAQMKPADLVDLLNDVFSHFDMLVDRYGLEKIKTIGDCYMVAAGVPRPISDHAARLARLALDFHNCTLSRTFHGRRITLRIGINSGSVIAGVIGQRKFIYDLWGDAVNTASRMESHGTGGTIQITEATYELIKDAFQCEARGMIEVKGKGPMPIWHVLRENEDHVAAKPESPGVLRRRRDGEQEPVAG